MKAAACWMRQAPPSPRDLTRSEWHQASPEETELPDQSVKTSRTALRRSALAPAQNLSSRGCSTLHQVVWGAGGENACQVSVTRGRPSERSVGVWKSSPSPYSGLGIRQPRASSCALSTP